MTNAFRKCPNLVTAPLDHKMYHEKSHQLMEYLRTYTTEIEQVSVDECCGIWQWKRYEKSLGIVQ